MSFIEIEEDKAAFAKKYATTEPAKRMRDESNTDGRTRERTPPPRRRINVIMGAYEQESNIGDELRKEEEITFTENDTDGLDKPHNDPLVVELKIGDIEITRILIDTGSSVDLIFTETLQRMNVKDNELKPCKKPLTSFAGDATITVGTIKLPVYVAGITKIVKFVVIDSPTIYNVILGTPWIHSLRAVPSTYHQCIKFPTPTGVYTLRGNQRLSRTCFITEHKLRISSRTCLMAKKGDKPPTLISGLRLAKTFGANKIDTFCDSQLVASQFSGKYETRNDRINADLQVVHKLSKEFDDFSLTKIPRSDNSSTNALAALASTSDPALKRMIPVENINSPSIKLTKGVHVINNLDESTEINDDEPNPKEHEAGKLGANWEEP